MPTNPRKQHTVDPEVIEEHGLEQWAESYKNCYILPECASRPPDWILVHKFANIVQKMLVRVRKHRKIHENDEHAAGAGI